MHNTHDDTHLIDTHVEHNVKYYEEEDLFEDTS